MNALASPSLLVMTIFLLAGCSTPQTPPALEDADEDIVVEETADEVESEGDIADLDGIEIERDIFDVTITIPGDLFDDGYTEEEVAAAVEEGGFTDGFLNSDGSVTYVIPSDVHAEMMDEFKVSIQETIDEIISDEPHIYKEITYNDSVDTFEVTVNRAEYENSWSFAGWALSFQASFYQWFNGTQDPEGAVRFIDEETGDVFDEFIWPEEE